MYVKLVLDNIQEKKKKQLEILTCKWTPNFYLELKQIFAI